MNKKKFMAALIKGVLAALLGALSTLVGVKTDVIPLGTFSSSTERMLSCQITGRFPVSANCVDRALLAASHP